MKPLKILVLDDEKLYTDKLAHFLENGQFQTYAANTPNDALKILQKSNKKLSSQEIIVHSTLRSILI